MRGTSDDVGALLPSIRLQTQKLSVGSSSLTPVSGMFYLENRDTLVVGLCDGSFHTVHFASTTPILDRDLKSVDDKDVSFTSNRLSKAARAVFAQAEGDIRRTDVNRIYGSACFDDFNTVVWFHEYVWALFDPCWSCLYLNIPQVMPAQRLQLQTRR